MPIIDPSLDFNKRLNMHCLNKKYCNLKDLEKGNLVAFL